MSSLYGLSRDAAFLARGSAREFAALNGAFDCRARCADYLLDPGKFCNCLSGAMFLVAAFARKKLLPMPLA